MRVGYSGLLLVLAALGLTILASPLLEPFERRAWDARLRLRTDAPWPPDLLLVAIDDDSIERSGARWPWPRDRQAQLLTRIRALGARTVFYDAVLEGATDPEGDGAMARALDGVVLAVGFHAGRTKPARENSLGRALTIRDAVVPRWPENGFVPPEPAFGEAAAGLGHISFFSDADRVVRRFTPAMGVAGSGDALPLASMRAWALHRGVPDAEVSVRDAALHLPGRRFPLHRGEVPIDFVPGSKRSPPRVSAWAILEDESGKLRRQFEGRLAVVYVDSVFTTDLVSTPVGASTPGGLLHAYVIRTLDGGRVPRPVPPALAWILVALPCAIVSGFAGGVSGLTTARRLLTIAIAFAGASVALVAAADRFLPVIAPMAFLVLSTVGLLLLASRSAEMDRVRLRALLAAPTVDAKTVALHVEPGEDSPNPATVIRGRYEIGRRLGRGGMGAVYLAKDRELARDVAIKVLESPGQKEAFARFRREALAVARLSHPNVVQIFEVGFDEKAPYLVMEYVPGGTIRDLLDRSEGPLPWQHATLLAAEIARGLGAAHRRGVVHRDVKPANVLLEGSERAKVTDFGIAKLAGEAGLTREGFFVGTLGYASPEQVTGRSVDSRTDVFSLGVTWFRMLTGVGAFHGETVDVIRQTTQVGVPDPRDLLPELPLAVSELLARLCALDPASRPPDGAAAAQALDALVRGAARK